MFRSTYSLQNAGIPQTGRDPQGLSNPAPGYREWGWKRRWMEKQLCWLVAAHPSLLVLWTRLWSVPQMPHKSMGVTHSQHEATWPNVLPAWICLCWGDESCCGRLCYLCEWKGPIAFLISCMGNSSVPLTFFAPPHLSAVQGCSWVSGVPRQDSHMSSSYHRHKLLWNAIILSEPSRNAF